VTFGTRILDSRFLWVNIGSNGLSIHVTNTLGVFTALSFLQAFIAYIVGGSLLFLT
jgi:hypothetical protein